MIGSAERRIDYPWGRVIELFGSLLYAAAIAFLLPRIFTHMEKAVFQRSDYGILTLVLAFIVLHIAIDWLSHTRREISISNDIGIVLIVRFAAWIVAICFLSVGHIELFDSWACQYSYGERPYCAGTTEFLLKDAFSSFFALTFLLNILILITKFNLTAFKGIFILLSNALKGDVSKNLLSSGFGDITKEKKLAEFLARNVDLSDSMQGERANLKVFMRSAVISGCCSVISTHFLVSGLLAAIVLHYSDISSITLIDYFVSLIHAHIIIVISAYVFASLFVSWFFRKTWIYCMVPLGFYLIVYSYIATFVVTNVIFVLMIGQILFSTCILILDPPALSENPE